MRICGPTLRWFLSVLLFVTTAPYMLAVSSCTPVLIAEAQSGDGLAQLNLGLAYANALDVLADPPWARTYSKNAAIPSTGS